MLFFSCEQSCNPSANENQGFFDRQVVKKNSFPLLAHNNLDHFFQSANINKSHILIKTSDAIVQCVFLNAD